jgi:hypothetical protein
VDGIFARQWRERLPVLALADRRAGRDERAHEPNRRVGEHVGAAGSDEPERLDALSALPIADAVRDDRARHERPLYRLDDLRSRQFEPSGEWPFEAERIE